MVNIQDPLRELLDKASRDNSYLDALVSYYFDLISSSDRQWIDKYWKEVAGVAEQWKGKYKTAAASYYIIQGYSLYFSSKIQESLEAIDEAFKHCDDTELFRNIKGSAWLGKGVCYRSQGRIDKTMESIVQASKLIDKKQPPQSWQVFTHRMLGEVHAFIGEFTQAEEHYREAMEIMEAIGSSTTRFRVFDGMGECYRQMGEVEKSKEYFQKALAVEDISAGERARALCDLGILYLEEGDKALSYLEESCALRKEHHLEDAYSTSLLSMGEYFLKTGQLEKAENTLREAYEIVGRYKVPAKQLHAYRLFTELYEKMGQAEKSLAFFHLYDDLQKDLNSQQVKNIFQLKNNHIAEQHKEIEQKHDQLKSTLQELARIKVSRKALFFSIVTVVSLVIATEVFLDPIIEQYSGNNYLGLFAKVIIAFLLKPIDSLYERLLFRKAIST